MGEDLRLGRILGFPVAVNWSVLIIVWLLTWALAEGLLPRAAPGASQGTYWLAGLLGALLFFLSLLAHELAHAVVARRSGVEVDGLTLWMFGGIARLRSEAASPRDELRIAAVGPATSVAAGALFGVVALVLGAAGAPRLLVAVPSWLAGINVVLALFNMIPGAPLDGGRVLRSILWRRSGDRLKATVSAARAGRAVGFGLIAVGLLEFLVGTNIGGLWTVMIGFFLVNAARAEEEQAVTRDALAGVRVADVMTPDPRTVPGWVWVSTFLDDHLLRDRFSSYPVVGPDGRIRGLVTLAGVKGLPVERRRVTQVSDIAVPLDRVPTAAPDEPLVRLLERPSLETGGRALVFDGDRLVGIVSPRDVARAVEWGALAHSVHPRSSASQT